MNQMFNQKNNLFRACAEAVFNDTGENGLKPSSVVRIKVEKGTEKLPSSSTPSSMINN